jgi:hypothetical protein
MATSASLFAMWSYADESYFTTWALLLHAMYFLASGVVAIGGTEILDSIVREGQFARWIFAPCLVISLAVATTVLYILYAAWGATWDEYCEDQALACRDLIMVFVVTHYFPPVALLLANVTDRNITARIRNCSKEHNAVGATTQQTVENMTRVRYINVVGTTTTQKTVENMTRVKYIVVLFQLSYVPTSLYGTFYDAETVYGASNVIITIVYGVTMAIVAIAWGCFNND